MGLSAAPEILFVEQLYYLWSAFLAKTSAKQGQRDVWE